MALAPRRPLLSVPSSSTQDAGRCRSGRARRGPISASAISPLTAATALRTPLPASRVLSPSRSSTASRVPVEAPEGTAARPRAPLSRMTSTSTVGLPRLSKISRPMDEAVDRGHAGPPGSRRDALSRLVVVPATPNGMPAAMAMMSPGPARPSRGGGRAGVLDDLRQRSASGVRDRVGAPDQRTAGARSRCPASGPGSAPPAARARRAGWSSPRWCRSRSP